MKLGVMFDAQDGMTWDRWAHLAAQAERLGFESLWRSDHLFSVVGRPQRPALEAWASLTYLATATKRLRFGTLVSPVTFRHPSVLALTAAAVDELSGGRLEVGLGAGWEAVEHEAFGIPFPPIGTRLAMLDESIAVMTSLWTQEEASFEGRMFTLRAAHCHPKPTQQPHPPIVVAGLGERVLLRIVAARADEWNAHGVTPTVYRSKRVSLERHCEDIGRDPASLRRSVAGAVVIAESAPELRKRIASLEQLFPLPVFFPHGAGNRPEDLRGRGWFAGRPDEIVEQIQAFAAEGVGRVMLQQLDVNDEGWMELVARDVLPHVL